MPTCREAAEMVARDELRRASWRQRLAVRLHLVMCPPCRRYAAQIRALGATVRELLSRQQPDRDTLQRMEQRILRRIG